MQNFDANNNNKEEIKLMETIGKNCVKNILLDILLFVWGELCCF